MDQVHVVRHKVLVEGQPIRLVAREMGIARNKVRKYLEQPAPMRVERAPRARPVLDAVAYVSDAVAGMQVDLLVLERPPEPLDDNKTDEPRAPNTGPSLCLRCAYGKGSIGRV